MTVSILVVDGESDMAELFRQRFPDLPVMMVTAYGDDERRHLAENWAQPSSVPSRSISTC